VLAGRDCSQEDRPVAVGIHGATSTAGIGRDRRWGHGARPSVGYSARPTVAGWGAVAGGGRRRYQLPAGGEGTRRNG
jgi:hypothetical protein